MKTSTIYLFWFIFIGILLSGCQTRQKWADKGLKKKWAAPFCAEEFPVKMMDSTTVIDSVRKAVNANYTKTIDSLTKLAQAGAEAPPLPDNGDYKDCKKAYDKQVQKNKELSQALTALGKNYIPCKPDTQYIRKTYTVRDVAMETALRDSLSEMNADLIKTTEQKEKAQNQRNWAVGIALVLGVLIALRLFKKI